MMTPFAKCEAPGCGGHLRMGHCEICKGLGAVYKKPAQDKPTQVKKSHISKTRQDRS